MPRYVAFLRAVNVGGARTVKMEVLRGIFQSAGFSHVESFIASGNIIFESPSRSAANLELQVEEVLLQALGYEITPFIRTGRDLARILAYPAFLTSSMETGAQLAVVFLSGLASATVKSAFLAFHSKTDEFRVHGREIFWLRHTIGDGAAYSTVPLDRVLEEPFTIRSLSTVKKIHDKYFLDE